MDSSALLAGALFAATTTSSEPSPASSVTHVTVNIAGPMEEDKNNARQVDALDLNTTNAPKDWDEYIGQEPMKRFLRGFVQEAKALDRPLPHILLADGRPGIGKTAMARLLARVMGVDVVELMPPFNIWTLANAASMLLPNDILFIDEVHKLSDSGGKGAEILLKLLEEGFLPMPDGSTVYCAPITVIAATTSKDSLPLPVLDRFTIKPFYQDYTDEELVDIVCKFVDRHDLEAFVTPQTAVGISKACRGTPRVAESMVRSVRPLAYQLGRLPNAEELLDFVEIEPDGLTRAHIHYLTAMRQYFAREARDGGVEYIVGEASIMQILNETKAGIGRIERFLTECGLLDKTPRGRRLSARGIARAEAFIHAGKGVRDV